MENEEYPIAKFLRLQNGDDIVAETVEMEDEKGILYMVVNPMKIIYIQSPQNGYLSVSFIPWVFTKICDHQEFMIHADDVLLISDVSEKMNEYYWANMNIVTEHEQKQEEIIQKEAAATVDEQTIADIFKELSSKRTYH